MNKIYPEMPCLQELIETKEKILFLKSLGKKRAQIISELRIDSITYDRSMRATLSEKVPVPFEKLKNNIENFKSRNNNFPLKDFSYLDVMDKFGPNPICYLTGKKLDYEKCNFVLDHFVATSRGGSNELENLRLVDWLANQMKTNLSLEDFFKFISLILSNNGYTVTKNY